MFIPLKPFHERRGPELARTRSRPGSASGSGARSRKPRCCVFGAPAVDGLGNAGGFKLMVEATGDVNFDALQGQADNLAAKGNQQPGLVGLFNSFRASTPQLYVDVDRVKVQDDGRGPHRRLRHAPGLPGRLLRQRLQPLRPHLAGQHPGRRPLPRERGRRQAAQGPQRRRRHGAAGRRGRHPRHRRAGARSPATTCSRRRRSPARRCPGSAPAASSRRWRTWRTGSCLAHDLRVDRAEPTCRSSPARSSGSATCGRTPSARSCWGRCWCSSCWRACTRAGRCRWR